MLLFQPPPFFFVPTMVILAQHQSCSFQYVILKYLLCSKIYMLLYWDGTGLRWFNGHTKASRHRYQCQLCSVLVVRSIRRTLDMLLGFLSRTGRGGWVTIQWSVWHPLPLGPVEVSQLISALSPLIGPPLDDNQGGLRMAGASWVSTYSLYQHFRKRHVWNVDFEHSKWVREYVMMGKKLFLM